MTLKRGNGMGNDPGIVKGLFGLAELHLLLKNSSEPEKIVEQKSLPHVDDLVYKKVVENFNKRYDGKLHDDQKELIAKYINFFESKNLEFKIYLNEEISRLKEEVKRMAESKEIKNDSEMLRKTSLLSEKMERFREQPIDDNLIKQVLKIQEITREIE